MADVVVAGATDRAAVLRPRAAHLSIAAAGDAFDAVTGEVRCDVPRAFLNGIADVDEHYMSTDSLDACPDSETDDVLPYDTAIDQTIDVGDILMFKPVILTSEGELNYDRRYDIARDSSIDVGDILMFKPVILTTCEP